MWRGATISEPMETLKGPLTGSAPVHPFYSFDDPAKFAVDSFQGLCLFEVHWIDLTPNWSLGAIQKLGLPNNFIKFIPVETVQHFRANSSSACVIRFTQWLARTDVIHSSIMVNSSGSQIRITVVAEDTTATDKMVGIAVNFLLLVLSMTLYCSRRWGNDLAAVLYHLPPGLAVLGGRYLVPHFCIPGQLGTIVMFQLETLITEANDILETHGSRSGKFSLFFLLSYTILLIYQFRNRKLSIIWRL